jgi:O-antigen ligase
MKPEKPPMPPEVQELDRRLSSVEPWALLAFILIVVGVVRLSKGLAFAPALLILSASSAATVIAAVRIVPAFVKLYGIKRKRDREKRRPSG